MAVLGVVVVTRAIEIGRHSRQVLGTVLAVVAPAHFDASNLGKRIRTIGRFQWASQKVFLLHGLRCQFGVDAAGAKEQESGDSVLPGAMDDAVLDGEVVADEFCRVGVVGDNAPHLGRGQEDVFRLVFSKELVGGFVVSEVKLGMGALEDVGVSLSFEVFDDGRANESSMPCHIDACVFVHADYSL